MPLKEIDFKQLIGFTLEEIEESCFSNTFTKRYDTETAEHKSTTLRYRNQNDVLIDVVLLEDKMYMTEPYCDPDLICPYDGECRCEDEE